MSSSTQPSSDETQILISSFNSKSVTLNKLLPVRISGYTILGLVDSGNSFHNAISLAVATKIGLTQYQSYNGPPVGTAQTGSNLNVVGIIKSANFHLTDEAGKIHKLASRLVVVKRLSCGLNISLPFLVDNGLDQLHSEGILFWTSRRIRFPLYRNMSHARRRMKREFIEESQASVINLGGNQLEVRNSVRQTIPPRTVKLIPAITSKNLVDKPTDSVFSFKPSFTNKMTVNKLHPDQDDSYASLNFLDQAVRLTDSDEVEIYFFNELDTPITISSNCLIGSIFIPKHHSISIDMNSILTIAPDDSTDPSWMNNTLSSDLPRSAYSLRRRYVCQVLNTNNNPTLIAHPLIATQLIDLIMSFWNLFYREGNCGGTEVIEHPVCTPKGLPPIRLKNRPVNPGLTDSLKEQIAVWLKDGVIRSGGVSPWNFPFLPVRKKMANGGGSSISVNSIQLHVKIHFPFLTSLNY